MPAPPRDGLLASEIRGLINLWVDVRCGKCTKSATIPLGMDRLIRYRTLTLGAFIARLKCEQCAAKPACIRIGDHPIFDAKHTIGAHASWVVDVTPEGAE